jgi:hypothetical protein
MVGREVDHALPAGGPGAGHDHSGSCAARHEWSDQLDTSRRVSYGAEYSEMFQQSAALVDKILKGAKPADLPVEQPWLVINLKTAKALRLTTRPHCWRGRIR